MDNAPSCCPGSRAWAVFLLRVVLGMCMLWAGLHKFGLGGGSGYAQTVAMLTGMFDKTLLAGFPSSTFAHALPFLEAGSGLLLLIGLRTRCGLVLAGLTLLGLGFGLMILGKPEMMTAQLLIYVLILLDAAALALLDGGNAFSIDACRERHCAPKP